MCVKKILIETGGEPEKIKNFVVTTHNYAVKIKRTSEQCGLFAYIEDSGYRGRHVWFFFQRWIPAQDAVLLARAIIYKAGKVPNDITIDVFPLNAKRKPDNEGQRIRLPLLKHYKTNKKSRFIDDDGVSFLDQGSYIETLCKNSYENVKEVIRVYDKNYINNNQNNENWINKPLDDLKIESEVIKDVLNGCKLTRYLCFKAKDTGYLIHSERLTLLFIIGHIGDLGKSFIHQIMSWTLNYKYSITEKFINNMPSRPVSCLKIRDEYKQITASFNCNCYFKLPKKCYPSPVLHAMSSLENEKVTLPVSSNTSYEKINEIKEEININKSALMLANKLLELKKQFRSLDKDIKHYENKLSLLFDSINVDRLDIEMGVLVRKNQEGKCIWSIEI
ncbi:UNVERIFIED_CONTAM: hypothetical protein Cloal_2193 [Acetivibrio alkalicellulosi]